MLSEAIRFDVQTSREKRAHDDVSCGVECFDCLRDNYNCVDCMHENSNHGILEGFSSGAPRGDVF